MSKHVRYCALTVALLSLSLVLSCGVSASVGAGGVVLVFEVAGKSFVVSFGDVGRIEVVAGETEQVATSRGAVFSREPTDTPSSATVRLPSESVGSFGRATAKVVARSQVLPLSGSATVRLLIARGDSSDPCADGALLAQYDVSFATGITSVIDEVFEISAGALDLLLSNDIRVCIEVGADFDADFTIGDIEITFGGSEDGGGTGDADTGEFNLWNVDTVENIHKGGIPFAAVAPTSSGPGVSCLGSE